MVFLQLLRSLIFIFQMYAVMAFMSLAYIPLTVLDRNWAYSGIRAYCSWVRLSARLLIGLRSEIRGNVPDGRVLVCAKHQSFFDILIICSVARRPRFVMKKQLLHAPIVGFFAKRIGCIAIDRQKGRLAVSQMLAGTADSEFDDGQLIIYPQGTRVAPGKRLPYKIGASILYDTMKVDCIPAATNVGVFWPRASLMRHPGTAVVEFLQPVPAGLSQDDFTKNIEETIERHSNRLMREAGFRGGLTEVAGG